MPPKPERIQIDDHFAAAKARSAAPPPKRMTGGRAALGVLLIAGASAGAWWWAVQPGHGGRLAGIPLGTTVADRQAAVAEQMDAEAGGPRQGGETSEQYQARLASIRARQATAAAGDPAGADGGDRGAAGTPAPAPGGPGTQLRSGVAPPPARPAALAEPDAAACQLAWHVNDHRRNRATHLRWLDICAQQHLVELARARMAAARDGNAANAARTAANNLAADIDTHQREARRVDDLLGHAEQRLVDYCAGHGERTPPLENPCETASGVAAALRALPPPSATMRPAPVVGPPQPADLAPSAAASR